VIKFKKWVHGLNPWLPYILTTFVFQVIRGAVVDSVIFGVASLLLIADWKRVIPWELPERPKYRTWMVATGMVFSAIVLYVSPRASLADAVLLIVMAPIAITLVYYRDHGPLPKSDSAMKLSVRLWMLVVVSMALFEMFAFMWASVYRDDKHFPTISVIVNPVLNNSVGRTVFLVLWMLAGASLFGLFRGRKK
jgi:hypothetical protein